VSLSPGAEPGKGNASAYIGVACAILGSIAFSGKTIIIKLAYQHGVEVWTLLALRMLFSLPFFLAMAWWAGAASLTRRDWLAVIALGFVGYYVGSYLDFASLQYISAGMGRLILYLSSRISWRYAGRRNWPSPMTFMCWC
jgi:drug/metabolite transporter (DMT)-like permease